MPTPIEAYRAGYEKGQKDGLGGALAEVTMGMLRDDPGGYFAAGQRDGAAGKKFSPPSDQVRKPAADINPFDDKVAVKTVCPNCGAVDWFEWEFLGRLTDPICGHSWYVGSGTYAAMQIRAAFAAGGKGAKYFTSGVSGGEGAWIGRALGWFMGVILGLGIRLEFGILMIPIQALAGLFGAKTASDMVARLIVLVVTLGGIGIGIYEIQHASSLRFAGSQQGTVLQPPSSQTASTVSSTDPISSPPPTANPAAVPVQPQPQAQLDVANLGSLGDLPVFGHPEAPYFPMLSKLNGWVIVPGLVQNADYVLKVRKHDGVGCVVERECNVQITYGGRGLLVTHFDAFKTETSADFSGGSDVRIRLNPDDQCENVEVRIERLN